mgnify:CR=1 FL=1
MTDTPTCKCPNPLMVCASSKCNHTPEEHKKGVCYLCGLPHSGPFISPDNRMDTKSEIDYTNQQPIIEMTETKNLLYMALRNLTFADSSHVDFMASLIYDTKTKTIEMRGRMRFEDTGKKTVFSDKKAEPYSLEKYNEKKKLIKSFTELLINDIPLFKPMENLFELEFTIGEEIDSITQKMNDSNRFNIGIIPKP